MVPSRLIVGLLGCLGCTFVYILRNNLSISILAMVDERAVFEDKEQNRTIEQDLCYDYLTFNRSIESGYHGSYQWSKSLQGIILGSYFYGYTMTQTLGGQWADKYGAKWICGLGVFVPAVCNALIPPFGDIHYSLIILMRLIIGAFHGVVFSSLFSLFAKWFTPYEKTLAITGTAVAGNLGGVIVMPLAGYLVKVDFLNGWPLVFYLTSLMHLIWFILWCVYVSNTPEEDRNISDKELKYISNENPNSKNVNNLSIPWLKIFTSKEVWASAVAKSTLGFGIYILTIYMPKYLDSVFGMAITKNSWFNSLMYAIYCSTLFAGGPLSTWVQSKGWISQSLNRKLFECCARAGVIICLLLVPIVGCDSNAVIILLLIGVFVLGFNSGGDYSSVPEYAPELSGTVFGITNTLSSVTGFVGPMLVGYLLDQSEGSIKRQWNLIWYLSAGVYTFGGVFYALFGTAEPLPWAVASYQEQRRSNKIESSNVQIYIK